MQTSKKDTVMIEQAYVKTSTYCNERLRNKKQKKKKKKKKKSSDVTENYDTKPKL